MLTDVIIPSSMDLASLSIDVWIEGEEVDGQRLIVASDIGHRTLVMNNIMPAPVCRYLKVRGTLSHCTCQGLYLICFTVVDKLVT